MVLAKIPGVRNFQQLRQISSKNTFHFLFSMEFDDQAAYDYYNQHPVHTAFVREKWQAEVAEFLEGDYIDLRLMKPPLAQQLMQIGLQPYREHQQLCRLASRVSSWYFGSADRQIQIGVKRTPD